MEERGITGRMTELYDVFVDWPGRLGRELPGIERHLGSVGARRVLDVGCGTGRHVQALSERGYEVHGADASADMLERARRTLGAGAALHAWRLGEPPPASLRRAAPFDAAIAMGNVWPSVLSEGEVAAACGGLRELVHPGGLVLLGLKAHAARRGGTPYMPLLKREHTGRPMWFVRFVDFEVPALEDGSEVCDLHLVVVAGGALGAGDEDAAEALLHRAGRQRVWSAAGLGQRFASEGFDSVRVSARLDDPSVPPAGDDVFLSALVARR